MKLLKRRSPKPLLIEALEPRVMLTGSPLAGDANSDGVVDLQDLSVVTSHWQQRTTAGAAGGDLNGDGVVDLQDLSMVTNHWQQTIYDGHSEVIGGVLNVWQPTPADLGPTYVPTAPLFGPDGVPDGTVIAQGQLADCYLLAELSANAFSHPGAIEKMVWTDATGIVVQWTGLESRQPVDIHTSDLLSASWEAPSAQTWWQYIEKTFMYFRSFDALGTSTNLASDIDFGFENTVEQQMGEQPMLSSFYLQMNAQTVAATLQTALAGNHIVTLDTSVTAPDLVPNHVYVVTAVDTSNSAAVQVTLWNPWGFFTTVPLSTAEANGVGFFEIGA